MTDHPVIMSAPMVAATLREVREPGTGKVETRRLLYSLRKIGKKGCVSPTMLQGYPPIITTDPQTHFPTNHGPDEFFTLSGWEQRKPGDRLWVRENFKTDSAGTRYAADFNPALRSFRSVKWKPSIHLPRGTSRLTLIIGSVKIERLQEVDEATALREGIECRGHRDFWAGGCRGTSALECFKAVWWSLHGIGSWNENPWVVAVRYRPILANIDAPEAKAA